MRKSKIKLFKVNKLFGDRDITITFENDVKIVIGENGLGKTTVLNILYYTLTNKLYKLSDFDFETIELKFSNNRKLVLPKSKLIDLEEDFKVPPRLLTELSRNLTSSQINMISDLFKDGAPRAYIIDKVRFDFDFNSSIYRRYPMSYLYNALKVICGYGESDPDIKKAKDLISKELENTEITL